MTDADIFRIEPQNPYPTEHVTLVNQATEKQVREARPALLNEVESFLYTLNRSRD